MINDHPLAGLFNQLTPEHVLDAVEVDGRRCTGRFIILNSYENRVYQFELEDESWVVGKFYRPGRWSRETILAEHEFLVELAAVEIPVASPIEITPGNTIGEVGSIMFSVFPRIGGRAPEELTDEQVKILGRLIGRIHNIGAMRDTEHRIGLTPETYRTQNLKYLTDTDAIHEEARDNYVATATQLIEQMTPLFSGVPMHRIHGDCHLANLVWTPREGPVFLDFDDMVVGPAVQDIWMLVPSFDSYGQKPKPFSGRPRIIPPKNPGLGYETINDPFKAKKPHLSCRETGLCFPSMAPSIGFGFSFQGSSGGAGNPRCRFDYVNLRNTQSFSPRCQGKARRGFGRDEQDLLDE